MMSDETAERIIIAMVKHRHVMCTRKLMQEAYTSAEDFHEWLDAYDVEHQMRRTFSGTLIRLWDSRSVIFTTDDNIAAGLGRIVVKLF